MLEHRNSSCEIALGTKIRLRDGVQLNATVYMPAALAAPSPCVLVMTPYTADSLHDRGVYFATHGLPCAIVDVRGRGDSEGVFRPLIQEAADGHDVVEWLAGQPYCDGKVGMFGGSYHGYCQWATAKEYPPHLATIIPAAAPFVGVDFPMRNNIFYPFLVRWLTYTSGRTARAAAFADRELWAGAFRRWHESGRAFREIDAVCGQRLPVLQEWLSHPQLGEYWDAYNPSGEQYSRLELPILTLTGSYDDDQPGALEHYKQHVLHASPAARARHYLVIGPWDHLGTSIARAEFGGLQCGPASLVDLLRLRLDWYAWTLGSGLKPEFLRQQVAYYVMGAECWRYADTLDAVTARHEALFLDSTANANDVFTAGTLGSVVGQGEPDFYSFDPRKLLTPAVEAEALADGGSLVDQSVILALRGTLLVYHSAPFAQDTEVSGFFRFTAWLAIDCPDTDFYVSVHEIDRDGRSIRLSTDVMRARYRKGLRSPNPILSEEPLRYDFTRFTFVARRVSRGHRLRLVVAPMGRLVEATFAERNFNAGGLVADESVDVARVVTVRLFHDPAHASALYVPLGHQPPVQEP